MTVSNKKAISTWVRTVSLVGYFVRGVGAAAIALSLLVIALADETTPFSDVVRAFHYPACVQLLVLLGVCNVLRALVISPPEFLLQAMRMRARGKP